MTACRLCRRPGWWCGHGAAATVKAPCVLCQRPTYCRATCGAARCLADHKAPAPAAESSSAAPARDRRAQAQVDLELARTAEQAQRASAVLDGPPRQGTAAGAPWLPPPWKAPAAAVAPPDDDAPLRLLRLLETDYKPTRRAGSRTLEPYWAPELPGMVDAANVVRGWSWSCDANGAPVARLDRNAAYLSAASSVNVPFGALEHTGPIEFDPKKAGYGLIHVYPWYRKNLPNPLGSPNSDQMWVPWPTIQLLQQLYDEDRWPDSTILDSYTSVGVRLTDWVNKLKEIRTTILERQGPESDRYAEFKVAFGQVFGLLQGTADPGQGRKWKCKARRPDWAHTIMAQASANLWRDADKCTRWVADGVVAVRNTDELHLTETALDVLTRKIVNGRPVIRIDNSGRALGTYKRKAA